MSGLTAIALYRVRGTAGAFVADPGEVISPTIIDWVEGYVPAQISRS